MGIAEAGRRSFVEGYLCSTPFHHKPLSLTPTVEHGHMFLSPPLPCTPLPLPRPFGWFLTVSSRSIRQVKPHPDSAASPLFYLPPRIISSLSGSTQRFSTFTSFTATIILSLSLSLQSIIYCRLTDGILILFSLSPLQSIFPPCQASCTSAPLYSSSPSSSLPVLPHLPFPLFSPSLLLHLCLCFSLSLPVIFLLVLASHLFHLPPLLY
jgi:hypothetical protein